MAEKSKNKKNPRKNDKKLLVGKSIFDHVKHIRAQQSPTYYTDLSELDRKTFNVYMILRILSMDPSIIDEISYLTKYIEVLPAKEYYKILISIIPKSSKYYKYIKKSSKSPNSNILESISNTYNIGYKDSIDYYNILNSTDNGIEELKTIMRNYAFSDKEIKKILDK